MGSRSKHNSEMSHARFCMGNTIGHQRNLLQPLLGAATGAAAGLAKVPRGEGGEGERERDGDYRGQALGVAPSKIGEVTLMRPIHGNL